MKRKTVVAASLSLLLLMASPAKAYSRGGGRSDKAPGQERASDNCNSHVLDQKSRAKGGPKKPSEDDSQPPTNCDHFWQDSGYVGKS